MSFLTWNFDKNFIYVIIYWILEIIYRVILYTKREYFEITKQIVLSEYLIVIFLNIGDLLSGFLVLYSKCVSKSDKIKDKETRTQLQTRLRYTKSDKLRKKFYIKLILVCALDYISKSTYWISFVITGAQVSEISFTLQKNITITCDIIMRYIFSIFILKIIIYKHRTFSFILIGIGLIILIINDILLMYFDESYSEFTKTLFYTAIVSINAFTFPLQDTFVKQIFSEEYLYPANMQFYRGIAESILTLVLTLIFYFSFKIKIKFEFGNLIIVIVTLILSTLCASVKAYITLKVIYHYSSQSVSFLSISQSFGGSITRFIDTFGNQISDEWEIIFIVLEIISILIILFASLVYDEIIIINKWELNKNVRLGIINRGELDTLDMNIDRDSVLDNDQSVYTEPNNEVHSED